MKLTHSLSLKFGISFNSHPYLISTLVLDTMMEPLPHEPCPVAQGLVSSHKCLCFSHTRLWAAAFISLMGLMDFRLRVKCYMNFLPCQCIWMSGKTTKFLSKVIVNIGVSFGEWHILASFGFVMGKMMQGSVMVLDTSQVDSRSWVLDLQEYPSFQRKYSIALDRERAPQKQKSEKWLPEIIKLLIKLSEQLNLKKNKHILFWINMCFCLRKKYSILTCKRFWVLKTLCVYVLRLNSFMIDDYVVNIWISFCLFCKYIVYILMILSGINSEWS